VVLVHYRRLKKCKIKKIIIRQNGISGTENFVLSARFWVHRVELAPSNRKKQVSAL
jgi:hypothetical protein